jgi:hypothetical protein
MRRDHRVARQDDACSESAVISRTSTAQRDELANTVARELRSNPRERDWDSMAIIKALATDAQIEALGDELLCAIVESFAEPRPTSAIP